MLTFREWQNPEIVKMNVPLLIRAFEHVREDIKSDIDLHKFVEKIIAQNGKVLTMSDYNKITH